MLCECKHCFRSFQSRVFTMTCDRCKELDEQIFEQMTDYLKTYPNSNAMQIAEGLGIKASLVLKYVDEGRLVRAKGHFERI